MFCTLMYIIGHQEKLKALEECFRVLKRGGRFYLWDFNIEQEAGIFIGNLKVNLPKREKLKPVGYGIKGSNLKQDFDELINFTKQYMEIEKIDNNSNFYSVVAKK